MPKILVADDNANIQKMVVLAFEERGIQVTTVANGEAAVRRIPDLMPDLILADIFMPVRNGYEVCEFIKKDQRFSHIPVILLVGAFDPLDEKEARRVSADGVLKKPFVPPDPLIAMVMSALEKNPNVVAELARAKAAKEAPPPPEPVATLAIPARPEPKPLPDFPEPSTPEEAALVYGYGRGVRAIEDPSLSGPAAKAPIAELDEEESDDAEFDGASTASDWRRDAMDFEVPNESANKPAFSAVEDFEPVKFPTESEFPPRRVRERDLEAPPVAEEITKEPIAALQLPVSVAETTVALATIVKEKPAPFAEVEAKSEVAVSAPVEAIPEAHSESKPELAPAAQVANEAAGEVAKVDELPAVSAVPEPQQVPETVPEPQAAAEVEPSVPASVPHWMDALAPSGSQSTGGGWMNTLAEQVRAEAKTIESSQETAAHDSSAGQPSLESAVAAEPSPSTLESVEAHAEASAEAIPVFQESEPDAVPVLSSIDEPIAPEQPGSPESASHEPASHQHDQPVHEVVAHAPEESWFAPAPPVFQRIYDDPVSAPVAVAHSEPDRALELDHGTHEPGLAFRDPGLVEPAAVRVTPEPLLVNDDAPQGPSDYGARPQEVTPLHSFFAAPPAEAAPAPSFAPAAESASAEKDERIPTVAPPNREALSEIPFLMPPPDFHPDAPEGPAAASAVNVDDVVRKVLERLGPQLHDLLSGGLRPLVENLLQDEINKKEK